MIWTKLYALLFSMNVSRMGSVKLDILNCGKDPADTTEGQIHNEVYPWLGVLYYTQYDGLGETRSVTTVVLIHEEFVVGNSADIGPMPKATFKQNARVLLGEGWERRGRRVRNYLVHPEYDETMNSVAIIHLKRPVRAPSVIKPICPSPQLIRQNKLWVVKFQENLDLLRKEVLPMEPVPADTCREFYIAANLYEARRRPSHVLCAISLATERACVWGAGSALVTRDIWWRWQLVGLSVYGAGCGAPSRYLDMLRYYPWIEDSLNKFQRITISKINNHKYVLRSGTNKYGSSMRFGDCDDDETQNLIYADNVDLVTNNYNVKSVIYNMTIYETVQYSCVKFKLLYASASAELHVQHFCPRDTNGPACYSYKGTRFDISVHVIFTESCQLEMRAYGEYINISLIDIQEWKWEEGTYYGDLHLGHTEYRGPTYMTQFGFEPLEEHMWVPRYNPFSMYSTSTEMPTEISQEERFHAGFTDEPTPSTKRTPKLFRLKTVRTTTQSKWWWWTGK